MLCTVGTKYIPVCNGISTSECIYLLNKDNYFKVLCKDRYHCLVNMCRLASLSESRRMT